MPEVSRDRALARSGGGASHHDALSLDESRRMEELLQQSEKKKLQQQLDQLKETAKLLESEISTKQLSLQTAEADLLQSLAAMEQNGIIGREEALQMLDPGEDVSERIGTSEELSSSGSRDVLSRLATAGSGTTVGTAGSRPASEEQEEKDSFLDSLTAEQKQELDELIAESADVERQEEDLRNELHAKQQELGKLTLYRQALEQGVGEEFDLALNLIDCVQSAEMVKGKIEDGDYNKSGTTSAGAGEDEDADGKRRKALLAKAIIPEDEKDTLTTIACHLLKVDFVRDEVLAPYFPLLFQHLPELAKYAGAASPEKPLLSPEYLLQVAVHPDTELETAFRLAQHLGGEDALLAGVRRVELIPILDTANWAEEHFLILAEVSPVHSVLLLEKLKEEKLEEAVGEKCLCILEELAEAAMDNQAIARCLENKVGGKLEKKSTVGQEGRWLSDVGFASGRFIARPSMVLIIWSMFKCRQL